MKRSDSDRHEIHDGSQPEKGRASRFPIFHVPHDGNTFPDEMLSSVCIPKDAFMVYHEKMRDKDVGALIPLSCRKRDMVCSFAVSRLLCDVERFIGPEEVMERYGMGFCYEKAFDGVRIKRVTAALREKTRKYYDAHHERINGLCAHHPRVLLIDLHSYSDEIVPAGFLRRGRPLPDLCVGVDSRFTPPDLARAAVKGFTAAGLTVAVNYPYRGCYVPEDVMHGEADCDFRGIMMEFNRSAYLHGQSGPDPEKAEKIRRAFRCILPDPVR